VHLEDLGIHWVESAVLLASSIRDQGPTIKAEGGDSVADALLGLRYGISDDRAKALKRFPLVLWEFSKVGGDSLLILCHEASMGGASGCFSLGDWTWNALVRCRAVTCNLQADAALGIAGLACSLRVDWSARSGTDPRLKKGVCTACSFGSLP